MLQLVQGRKKGLNIGDPLHMPFAANAVPNPDAPKLIFRKGQLAMLAAPPGVGKSLVVQYGLQKGDGKGNYNYGIYFSADSDPFTMFTRGASFALGCKPSKVEVDLRDATKIGAIESTVATRTPHMAFDFRSEVTAQHMVEVIGAYATQYGRFPEFIVMDNLKNFSVDSQMTDEFAQAEESLVFLNEIAHMTGAAVIALHHVTGEHEGAAQAIPLSGVRGKLSKTPSAIYTMFKSNESELIFSVVKNRAGKADAKGVEVMGAIGLDLDHGTMH